MAEYNSEYYNNYQDELYCPYSQRVCQVLSMFTQSTQPTCFLGFICDDEYAFQNCGFNVTIRDCSHCRVATVTVLGVFLGLVAFLGLFLNALVIATVLNVKRNSRSPFHYMKMSLALADCLWGVFIFGFVIPDIAMTLQSAPKSLIAYLVMSQNTPLTILDYVVIKASQVASLYHVAFFAVQRFLAITFCNWFGKWGKSFTFLGLGFVWIFTFSVVFIEVFVAAPNFQRDFIYSAFLFSTLTSSNYFTIYFWFVIDYVLPFATMTIMTIATGISIKVKMGNISSSSLERIRRQRSIFGTLLVMEVVLFFAIAPLVTIYFILIGSYGCYEPTLAAAVCLILAANNGVMDPLVYTINDDDFKKNCRQLYGKLFGKPKHTGSSFPSATFTTNL